MDNFQKRRTLYSSILRLVPRKAETEDDQQLIDAFKRDQISHACQAIRDTKDDEIKFQHLTLRIGPKGDNDHSPYKLDLSPQMRHCLDLFGLYLSIQQISFQLEAIHPDLINDLVVLVQADTLDWPAAKPFIKKLYAYHRHAMGYIIPCIQLHDEGIDTEQLNQNLREIREHTEKIWFDIKSPTSYIPFLEQAEPSAVKLSQAFNSAETRIGLIEVIKYLRVSKIDLVSGQIDTLKELNQLKRLGARYYFGYISDLPTTIAFNNHQMISR